MKHGGSRANAGRKSKAEELKITERLDAILGENWDKEIFEKIKAEALKGSFQHAQLLVQYRFGKPQDKVDVTTNGKDLPTAKEIVFRDYDKS
jgi:hypothetical protein